MQTPSDLIADAAPVAPAGPAWRRGGSAAGSAGIRSLTLALAVAAALLAPAARSAAAAASYAPAAAPPASPPALSATARRDLRQDIERQYQVSGVHNGVLLRPRAAKMGVHEVEVSGDGVSVNGARVSPEVLRSWLGDADATPLLALLAVPPADRQALFDLHRDVADTVASGAGQVSPPSPPAAPPAEGVAPAPPAASDDQDEPSRVPQAPAVPPLPPMTPLPQTAPPSPPPMPTTMPVNTGSRVRFGGPITVERNEVAEGVVAVGGSVHIDGEVIRDVQAVGGSVRVNGRVGGQVLAVGGSVHLGSHAEVMGDVASIGGTVIREPGAVVHGSLSDVGSILPTLFSSRDHDDDLDAGSLVLAPLGHSLHMFWVMASLLLLLLAVSLVVLLGGGALEQVRARVASEPGTVAVAGLAGQVLAGPTLGAVVVVLIITVVGCVLLLLIPFVLLALAIAAVVGFAGVAYQVGRLLEQRFDSRVGGPYLTTIVGVLAIEALSVIGHILAIGGSVLHLVSAMFLVCGLVVRYVAWTMGFGAAILTAFANRPQRLRRAPAFVPAPVAPMPYAAPAVPVVVPPPPAATTGVRDFPPPPPPAPPTGSSGGLP